MVTFPPGVKGQKLINLNYSVKKNRKISPRNYKEKKDEKKSKEKKKKKERKN